MTAGTFTDALPTLFETQFKKFYHIVISLFKQLAFFLQSIHSLIAFEDGIMFYLQIKMINIWKIKSARNKFWKRWHKKSVELNQRLEYSWVVVVVDVDDGDESKVKCKH